MEIKTSHAVGDEVYVITSSDIHGNTDVRSIVHGVVHGINYSTYEGVDYNIIVSLTTHTNNTHICELMKVKEEDIYKDINDALESLDKINAFNKINRLKTK